MPSLYLENSYLGEFIPFFDAHDKDFYLLLKLPTFVWRVVDFIWIVKSVYLII